MEPPFLLQIKAHSPHRGLSSNDNVAGSDLFVSAGLGLWVREAGGTQSLPAAHECWVYLLQVSLVSVSYLF